MNPQEKTELLTLLEQKEKKLEAQQIDCSKLTRIEANLIYDEVDSSQNRAAQRHLCETDLFYLLTRACKRRDVDRDWLYDRCREIDLEPNECLDLWAREHYKSTLITFGKSIQSILKNPNVLIGIFSHTRPNAKGFLEQIKRELEQNNFLQELFPDVLYKNPKVDSPKWSLDSGIIVKRTSNPKEATIEAWGVVDGQPTGKHFTDLVYDDVVTRESVTTPEQIKKTTEALELSYNLGAIGGVRRFIGTRYHANDSYRTLLERGTAKPRIYTATHDGTMDGRPVFLDQETLMKKRRDMGPYTFSTQMLQNPVADKAMGFKVEWLKYYEQVKDHEKWNKYILIDPASQKKATSDYTVMLVLGLAPDKNFYLLDAVRDRLNLTQRAKKLFELHRQWLPKAVGYERYGMQSDIEHMNYVMEQENYRFSIIELGGALAKEDRIRKLIPPFEQGRVWLPKRLIFSNYEGRTVDFVQVFIEDEYLSFPVATHDDMMDCLARILDPELDAKFPKEAMALDKVQAHYASLSDGWME